MRDTPPFAKSAKDGPPGVVALWTRTGNGKNRSRFPTGMTNKKNKCECCDLSTAHRMKPRCFGRDDKGLRLAFIAQPILPSPYRRPYRQAPRMAPIIVRAMVR